MQIDYNVTGEKRKTLVEAISQELNAPTKYLGAPTFAYEVGGYHIDKLIFSHQTVLRPLLLSLRCIKSEDSMEKLHDLDKKLEENAEQRKVLITLQTRGYLEPAVYNKGNNELLQEAERIQRQKESIISIRFCGMKSISVMPSCRKHIPLTFSQKHE